jgi:hypothetical protein
MGSDTDEYYGAERPGRKPSLQARLQSGMYVCYASIRCLRELCSVNSEGIPTIFCTA